MIRKVVSARRAVPAQDKTRGKTALELLQLYLVSLFIVFLHFAAQVSYCSELNNRYFFRWDTTSAVALAAAPFLGGAVLALGAWVVMAGTRRTGLPHLERIVRHLLPLGLVSGLLAAFPALFEDHPTLPLAIWLVAMLAIGFSAACPGSPLVRYAYNACLVFSPVAFLMAVQILTWESWEDTPRTEFAPRKAETLAAPVFVFLFDEWSYPRSTACGEFLPFFRNVRRLCDRSVVFRNARSPYNHTSKSLPRFLYQCDWNVIWKDGRQYWDRGDATVPTTETPSLFQAARQCGYNTYLLGWHLPYNRILGNQVDYCQSYETYVKGDHLVGEVAFVFYRNLRFMTDPFSQKLARQLEPEIYGRHYFDMSQQYREEMFRILDTCPRNTFALFHVPQPHGPNVLEPDGSYAGPPSPDGPTPKDYRRGLLHLDSYVGKILERLGPERVNDALIILTSDHAWVAEQDPAFREDPDWRCRVPLIVKLPGQKSRLVVDNEVCTNQLKPLFTAVFGAARDLAGLTDLVRSLPARHPGQGAD